jgi:hypothetical protein
MKTIRLCLVGLGISLSIFASRVFACTCAEMTVAEYRDSADAVFLAKVVGKAKSDALEKDGVEVTLEVERVWKGNISKRTVVYTGATDDLYLHLDLCATRFRSGERYVVFANGKDKFWTNVCTGTGGFPYAATVIKQLGKGRLPRTDPTKN